MKRSVIVLLIISLISIIGAGCSINGFNSNKEEITLYFSNTTSSELLSEKRVINFKENEKYKVILEELIKGPSDSELIAKIPVDTKVNECIAENNHLTINLDSNFNNFSDQPSELMAIATIVNTMTEFDNIDSVKIVINGAELELPNGEVRGFMDTFPTEMQTVILYYSYDNANSMLGERRGIFVNDDTSKEDFFKKVVEELVMGPTNDELYRTIPPEAKVLRVNIENELVHIDFSAEMHTKHWHGATGEQMTIYSLANTLTEFDDIIKVKLTVEGQPLNIEHIILDEPIVRHEEIIAK